MAKSARASKAVPAAKRPVCTIEELVAPANLTGEHSSYHPAKQLSQMVGDLEHAIRVLGRYAKFSRRMAEERSCDALDAWEFKRERARAKVAQERIRLHLTGLSDTSGYRRVFAPALELADRLSEQEG